MPSLEQQIYNQRNWRKFTIAKKSYKLLRGTLLIRNYCDDNLNEYKYARILGSCIRHGDGNSTKTYLVKIGLTIPTVNSIHIVHYVDLNELYQYKVALKDTFKKL